MVARSKDEQRRSVDWYRRLADDVKYRQELRRLERINDQLWDIMHALQHLLNTPIDTSMIGLFPDVHVAGVSIPKPLLPPPPKKVRKK